MKKVYILLPAFISYIVISITALILPGYSTDSWKMIGYGYPLMFLYVDKETTLTLKDTILDNIGINAFSFFIDVLILVAIINIFIWIYKKIRARIKKPDSAKI